MWIFRLGLFGSLCFCLGWIFCDLKGSDSVSEVRECAENMCSGEKVEVWKRCVAVSAGEFSMRHDHP